MHDGVAEGSNVTTTKKRRLLPVGQTLAVAVEPATRLRADWLGLEEQNCNDEQQKSSCW